MADDGQARATPLTVLSIVGTRPEAVKMAPVIRALAQQAGIRSLVCATAQHREMLDQVFDLFAIRPDVDLNLMQPNQTLPGLTALALTRVSQVLQDLQPDLVLAQGDTTTVMVAGLASFYAQIPMGHVEAG
ncbi:MAG: UDP-N-acetylglucosamine 2-epimerase, partial [Anaerolineae bacterium]